MIPHSDKRTAQEKMLLTLSLGTSIGILPFAIYRAYEHDWYVAILDLVVIIGMLLLFFFVYKTRNVKSSSVILILVALLGNIVSFYLKGINQVYWIFPGMLAAYYIMKPLHGMLLNFILLSLYIPGLVTIMEVVNIATILITIIISNMIAYVFASGLRSQEIILKKLASEDYLTSTGNRRALDFEIKELHNTLKNHDKTASLVLLDLDHFKKVNDNYGHIKGDKVLVKLSELLTIFYHEQESIFRYGGEEFLVICPNQSVQEAAEKADRFRKKVKKNILIEEQEQTISLGVAEYQKEESVDEWIHRVDLALYQAKNSGRDKVIQV